MKGKMERNRVKTKTTNAEDADAKTDAAAVVGPGKAPPLPWNIR